MGGVFGGWYQRSCRSPNAFSESPRVLRAPSRSGRKMPQNGRASLGRVGVSPFRCSGRLPSSEPVESKGKNSCDSRHSLARFCRLARRMRRAVLSAGSAHAASISVESTGPDKPPVVVVQGSFEGKDGEQFFTKTGSLTAAIVRLESNGGSLVAGIQIGETIRLKGLQTLVPAGARCASACAMAWLGGTQRFMGPGAQIGLHLAYNANSEQGTGVANALLGAYLNRVGLPLFLGIDAEGAQTSPRPDRRGNRECCSRAGAHRQSDRTRARPEGLPAIHRRWRQGTEQGHPPDLWGPYADPTVSAS